MQAVIIIIVIILALVIAYISMANTLARAVVKIDEASSGIDVALTKRYDVLTKLIETVKGYAKHEKETLFETIKLRQGMSVKEQQDANNKMTEQFNKLNLVVENYPELKASENFKVLQQSILDVEEHLQAARRLYNANISHYNQLVVAFPTSMIANMKGYTKKDFFEAEEIKKKDVEVKF